MKPQTSAATRSLCARVLSTGSVPILAVLSLSRAETRSQPGHSTSQSRDTLCADSEAGWSGSRPIARAQGFKVFMDGESGPAHVAALTYNPWSFRRGKLRAAQGRVVACDAVRVGRAWGGESGGFVGARRAIGGDARRSAWHCSESAPVTAWVARHKGYRPAELQHASKAIPQAHSAA
jgi:hypothetical protein